MLSTAQRHTNFLDSNRMRLVLGSSDFDLADLKRKPMTIYLCLPFEHVSGQFARWLRLMITLSLTALSRTKGPTRPGTLFLLDEFAALGHLRMAERGMAEGRAYGVKMWPILQDLNQLKDNYRDGWQTFIGNAASSSSSARRICSPPNTSRRCSAKPRCGRAGRAVAAKAPAKRAVRC
ncbi:hypothetical protein JCM17843_10000 [Kordiimonadales bacterium JCM 17843]|nr:hypothetical protein JCM17843_10000 [Kordiimonadales bacterium JCM 17843]